MAKVAWQPVPETTPFGYVDDTRCVWPRLSWASADTMTAVEDRRGRREAVRRLPSNPLEAHPGSQCRTLGPER